jgi:hypothetical protein
MALLAMSIHIVPPIILLTAYLISINLHKSLRKSFVNNFPVILAFTFALLIVTIKYSLSDGLSLQFLDTIPIIENKISFYSSSMMEYNANLPKPIGPYIQYLLLIIISCFNFRGTYISNSVGISFPSYFIAWSILAISCLVIMISPILSLRILQIGKPMLIILLYSPRFSLSESSLSAKISNSRKHLSFHFKRFKICFEEAFLCSAALAIILHDMFVDYNSSCFFLGCVY